MRIPGFVGPAYQLRGQILECQRCVNLYPERDEVGPGRNGEVACFYGTPGKTKLATVGDGPIRGVYAATNGSLFVASGDYIYKVSKDWVATKIGAVTATGLPVSMTDNGRQLLICDGVNGFLHTLDSTTYKQIGDFPGGNIVAFQDTYFITNKPGSPFFFISDNNNGDSWNGLDYGSVEGSPDQLVSLISNNSELWLFGSLTTEVWTNVGNPDFPFQRIQGALIAHGCIAPYSVAKIQNTVFWLSQDDRGQGIVMAATGFQPKRISTHAIEYAIQQFEDLSQATAFTYQEEGHVFYCLNFPGSDGTWVYDASTGMWHERASLTDGILQRDLANFHAFAHGVHVVGDCYNGNIYKQDLDIYDEDGGPIIRLRTSPHQADEMKRLFFHKFQLDLWTGVGLDGATQGVDPQIMLSWSNDGGLTWNGEQWVSAGKIGNYKWRAIWRRLGFGRDRVWKIQMSDPVKWIINGAMVDVTKGES